VKEEREQKKLREKEKKKDKKRYLILPGFIEFAID
jgi:hypothetical protein